MVAALAVMGAIVGIAFLLAWGIAHSGLPACGTPRADHALLCKGDG